MFKYLIVISLTLFGSTNIAAQQPVMDSSLYYDDLFSELDAFLDSLTKPRTTVVVNVEGGSNYFNYATNSTTTLKAQQKLTLSPSVGYFHKSGVGFMGSAAFVSEQNRITAYQYALTGSYDYIKIKGLGAGTSFTHFFTKDSLSFYTSPLANEVAGYITYRGTWLRPTISATYGWGTRSSVEERKEYITPLRLRRGGSVTQVTEEQVADFSIAASVKHDFYWLDKFGKNNVLRLTPQVTFTSGTQNFGFNQTTNSYALKHNKANVIYNSENVALDDTLQFQPLSLTGLVRGEVSFGSFFIQPQLILDYYFPAQENRFTTAFRLNVGVSF